MKENCTEYFGNHGLEKQACAASGKKILISTARMSLHKAALAAISVVAWTIVSQHAHAQSNPTIVNISPAASNFADNRPDGSQNGGSGGRVNGIGTHPQSKLIAWVASEQGGLFKTEDGGDKWIYVPGHRPQSMWDVKVSPADAMLLVATSRFDGRTKSASGINVSRDGGVTWTRPETVQPPQGFCKEVTRAQFAAFGIAFNPDSPNEIYVGTDCGLAISTDRGQNWRHIDPRPTSLGGRVFDVIVHHSGIIDVCGVEGHFRSSNKGESFDEGSTDELKGVCSLAVSPDEAKVLLMSVHTNDEFSELYESIDGGMSWTGYPLWNPDGDGIRPPQGRIPFLKVNDRTGSAFDLWFGDVQLRRKACTTPSNPATSSKSRCFEMAPPPTPGAPNPFVKKWELAQKGAHWDVGDIAFDPAASVDACPILFSNDGGVYFNGMSPPDCHELNLPAWEWKQPQTNVSALWLWDLDGNVGHGPDDEGIYMGQQDTGAFGTERGAADTRDIDWSSPSCCDITDIEAEASRVVLMLCCWKDPPHAKLAIANKAMNEKPEVLSSIDHPDGNLHRFKIFDTLTNYGPDQYAVVTSSGVYFTSNIAPPLIIVGTKSIEWKPLGTGVPAGMCSVSNSKGTSDDPVFIARAGGSRACSIGGAASLWMHEGASTTGNWIKIKRDGNSAFGAFGIDPSNHKHIVANDLSGTNPTMVRTTDGGTTWKSMPKLDKLLTGNGEFLMKVQNGGFDSFTFTPYHQASLVAINPHNSKMMIAGGHDSGVFLSVNEGEDWTLLTDPLNNTALRPHISRPLFAHFEDRGAGHWNIYIGASGRGAWRISVTVGAN